MQENVSIDKVYSLLADIWAILGRYEPEVFQEAQRHVAMTFRGLDREVMDDILRMFLTLTQRPLPAAGGLNEPSTEREAITESSEKKQKVRADRLPETDPLVREVGAILEDREFLESKQDVLKLIKTHFHEQVKFRPGSKDSRNDLVAKAINAFKRMSQSEQQAVFSALRREFLKNRKSRLEEWSEIITNVREG